MKNSRKSTFNVFFADMVGKFNISVRQSIIFIFPRKFSTWNLKTASSIYYKNDLSYEMRMENWMNCQICRHAQLSQYVCVCFLFFFFFYLKYLCESKWCYLCRVTVCVHCCGMRVCVWVSGCLSVPCAMPKICTCVEETTKALGKAF